MFANIGTENPENQRNDAWAELEQRELGEVYGVQKNSRETESEKFEN